MDSFVHVPRTGGTSIWRAIGRDGYPKGRRGTHLQHITASRLRELQPWRFTDGRVFGVFRNPWERLVSLWAFLYHGDVEMTPANFRAWIHGGMKNRYNQTPILYLDEPDETPIRVVSPQCTWLDDKSIDVIDYGMLENVSQKYAAGKKSRYNGGWWTRDKQWYDKESKQAAMCVVEPDLDFQNERNKYYGI
jgi:hypothetical protein